MRAMLRLTNRFFSTLKGSYCKSLPIVPCSIQPSYATSIISGITLRVLCSTDIFYLIREAIGFPGGTLYTCRGLRRRMVVDVH